MSDKIGDERFYKVRGTGGGVKVVEVDGRGMAPGTYIKRNLRYFYGDDAEDKAHDYAESKADENGTDWLGITERQR